MFGFDFREGQGQESGAYGVIGATQTKLEWTSHSSRGEVRKPMTSRSDLAAFIAHELSKWQHDRDPVRLKCLREWCRLQCGSCNAGLDDKSLFRPLRSATAPSRLEPAASKFGSKITNYWPV